MQLRYHNLKFLIMSVFSVLVVLALVSCQPSSTAHLKALDVSISDEDVVRQDQSTGISIASSYITAGSIAELTLGSTLIVIGKVEKVDQVVNKARDVNDISKPDLRLLILGQVYQVSVDTLLKGKDPGLTMFIVQREGFLTKPQESEEPSPEDVEMARQYTDHIPFVAGNRYLLFLEPLYGFEERNYFVNALHPWRFNVTDPNHVYPESPAHLLEIPPSNLATVIEQIQKALTVTPEPTVISPLPTPIVIETIVPDKPAAP